MTGVGAATRRPDPLLRDTVDGVMPTTYSGPVLAWYARHARDLPWRAPDATPWGVLVSEFMLQQTPVARVLPEYLKWMARWPVPAALATRRPERRSGNGAGSATRGARSGCTRRLSS